MEETDEKGDGAVIHLLTPCCDDCLFVAVERRCVTPPSVVLTSDIKPAGGCSSIEHTTSARPLSSPLPIPQPTNNVLFHGKNLRKKNSKIAQKKKWGWSRT